MISVNWIHLSKIWKVKIRQKAFFCSFVFRLVGRIKIRVFSVPAFQHSHLLWVFTVTISSKFLNCSYSSIFLTSKSSVVESWFSIILMSGDSGSSFLDSPVWQCYPGAHFGQPAPPTLQTIFWTPVPYGKISIHLKEPDIFPVIECRLIH